ncbi:alpha-1A adrenergic receptor-like [Clytia hemisphaerica]|uniref:G-protein coupled receptors family 1 profile domain-containing protein n=1 Tax=Clytia hemisphaerica TaxID=252671 RepID=A0A7M5V7Z6_9CNID
MSIIDPLAAILLLNITGFIVILFNGFSLYVFFSQRKHKRISNIPMIWILTANVLIGAFPFPVYGLKKYNFTDPYTLGRICDAWRYTYFSGVHLAMCSLLLMTVQKILILSFPLRYQRIITGFRTNLIFGVAWLFLLIFDMIPFFPFSEHDDEYCHYKIKKDWALAMNIITMAIPLPVIIGCYGYMLYLAFGQYVRIQKTTSISHNGSSKKKKPNMLSEVKATRKVALIIGAYILCWTPSTLYYLIEWLCPHCYPKNYEPHKTWIRFFFKLLVMMHALVTPIIFCCQSREFQKDASRSMRRFSRATFDGTKHSNTTYATDSH